MAAREKPHQTFRIALTRLLASQLDAEATRTLVAAALGARATHVHLDAESVDSMTHEQMRRVVDLVTVARLKGLDVRMIGMSSALAAALAASPFNFAGILYPPA